MDRYTFFKLLESGIQEARRQSPAMAAHQVKAASRSSGFPKARTSPNLQALQSRLVARSGGNPKRPSPYMGGTGKPGRPSPVSRAMAGVKKGGRRMKASMDELGKSKEFAHRQGGKGEFNFMHRKPAAAASGFGRKAKLAALGLGVTGLAGLTFLRRKDKKRR